MELDREAWPFCAWEKIYVSTPFKKVIILAIWVNKRVIWIEILYFVGSKTQFSLTNLWVCFKVFSVSSTAKLNMICTILEAQKVDNWEFF